MSFIKDLDFWLVLKIMPCVKNNPLLQFKLLPDLCKFEVPDQHEELKTCF